MRKWLRVYFWFICLLIFGFTILDINDGAALEFLEFVDWGFTLISLSGIYAYCYSKPFISAVFWKVFLWVLIIWDLFFVSDIFSDDPNLFSGDFGLMMYMLIVLLFVSLVVPGYIALYLLSKEFNRKDSFEMKA